MRLLFKRAIPWSDRVYNAFGHVKSARCCTPAQRQSGAKAPVDAKESLRTGRLQDNTQPCCSSRCPQRAAWIVLHLEERPLKWHFFKEGKSQSICTMFWYTQKGKNCTADCIIIYKQKHFFTILQCFCFIEQNTTWKYLLFELFCSTWKTDQ